MIRLAGSRCKNLLNKRPRSMVPGHTSGQAGRLRRIKDDAGNWLSDEAYGATRQRIFRNLEV